MAFYAEMIRRDSWLVNNANMIYMYKQKRYNDYLERQERKRQEYKEWYESLTDEERAEVDRKKKERQEQDLMRTLDAVKGLLMMPITIAQIAMGSSFRYEQERYGGVYKADGTVNHDYFKELEEKKQMEELNRKLEQEAIDVDCVEVD